MAFSFSYMASHFGLDLVDEMVLSEVIDYLESHLEELENKTKLSNKALNPAAPHVLRPLLCSLDSLEFPDNIAQNGGSHDFRIDKGVWRYFSKIRSAFSVAPSPAWRNAPDNRKNRKPQSESTVPSNFLKIYASASNHPHSVPVQIPQIGG